MSKTRRVNNRVSNTGTQRIGEALLQWAAKQQICNCPWTEAIELIEFPRGQLKIRCMSCDIRIDVIPAIEGFAVPDLVAALKPFAALYAKRLDEMDDDVPLYQHCDAVIRVGDVRQARAVLADSGKRSE